MIQRQSMVANSVHSSPRLYDLGAMSDKNSLASILHQTAQVDALSVRPLAPVSPPSSIGVLIVRGYTVFMTSGSGQFNTQTVPRESYDRRHANECRLHAYASRNQVLRIRVYLSDTASTATPPPNHPLLSFQTHGSYCLKAKQEAQRLST